MHPQTCKHPRQYIHLVQMDRVSDSSINFVHRQVLRQFLRRLFLFGVFPRHAREKALFPRRRGGDRRLVLLGVGAGRLGLRRPRGGGGGGRRGRRTDCLPVRPTLRALRAGRVLAIELLGGGGRARSLDH